MSTILVAPIQKLEQQKKRLARGVRSMFCSGDSWLIKPSKTEVEWEQDHSLCVYHTE